MVIRAYESGLYYNDLQGGLLIEVIPRFDCTNIKNVITLIDREWHSRLEDPIDSDHLEYNHKLIVPSS